MSKSEFARRINKARQNVNDILERKSMDTDLLLAVSRALKFDFFQVYIEELNRESQISEPGADHQHLKLQLHSCEKELSVAQAKLQGAQREIELMTEIMDLMRQRLSDVKS